MDELIIRSYKEEDEDDVVYLWDICGLIVPKNDPIKDIHEKILFQPDLFLVGVIDNKLIGTIMIGYEGHRGWINYLAIHPDYRKKGYAKKLIDYATILLKKMGCQKINVQIRNTNKSVISFYEKCGFTDDEVIGFGKRI